MKCEVKHVILSEGQVVVLVALLSSHRLAIVTIPLFVVVGYSLQCTIQRSLVLVTGTDSHLIHCCPKIVTSSERIHRFASDVKGKLRWCGNCQNETLHEI